MFGCCLGTSMDRAPEDQRLEGRHNIFNLNSAAVIIHHASGPRWKPEPVTSCGFFGDSQSPGNFLEARDTFSRCLLMSSHSAPGSFNCWRHSPAPSLPAGCLFGWELPSNWPDAAASRCPQDTLSHFCPAKRWEYRLFLGNYPSSLLVLASQAGGRRWLPWFLNFKTISSSSPTWFL